MTLVPCPECAHQISDEAFACPQCGKPLRPQPMPYGGYEYRSKETLFGWPLVHVATGFDPATGRKRVARGVIAIGDVAVGGVAVGGCALGGIAIGGCAIGAVALGGMAVALLLALGGGAISTGVAIGGGALGYYAFGGGAFGPHPLGGNSQDPQAIEFFSEWLGDWVRQLGRRPF